MNKTFVRRPRCEDSCYKNGEKLSHNDKCEDGGWQSKSDDCEIGTDCSDCMLRVMQFYEPDWGENVQVLETWIDYMDWIGGSALSLVIVFFLSSLLAMWECLLIASGSGTLRNAALEE